MEDQIMGNRIGNVRNKNEILESVIILTAATLPNNDNGRRYCYDLSHIFVIMKIIAQGS